ncbi:ZBT38 protein, partial [Atractosteus spatula]|nr:ZBT38 protein [Atractosteus spatula]
MKTYVHLLAFIFTFVFSYCIMQAIRKEAALRNQVRYILLCHHLVCVVAFFGVGILFHGLRMFRVAVPRIVCWIIFDIQVTLGRGIILTLTLMALNTCLSVCAPLRYLSIIHSLKGKVIIITWILATLNPVWSTIQASCTVQLTYLTERDPTCPTALHGTDSRIAAIVFLALLSLLIIVSYCLIYREGKRAGHFSRSNIRGRKTILIHSLQMSLHIIPTFIILATVRKPLEGPVRLAGEGGRETQAHTAAQRGQRNLRRKLWKMTVMSPASESLMDSSHFQTVLCCLNDQRIQGMFCDVTIVVEDIKFKAHKNVLAASSFYFKNAFSSQEFWVSGQVLELLDLKSDTFAGILNFIYSAKVALTGSEDVKLLVAAGKKLGIPFLENLAGQEKRSSNLDAVQTASPDSTLLCTESHSLKKETPNSSNEPRTEESECASGPRITNAFSIFEAGPNDELFSPLDLRANAKRSQDPENVPEGCPTQSVAAADCEQTQTLSEHSYAANQMRKTTEQSETELNDGRKESFVPTRVLTKPMMSLSCSPLKKRHRLSSNLIKTTVVQSSESPQAFPNTTGGPLATSESQNDPPSSANGSLAENTPAMETSTPVLETQTDPSQNVDRCEYCNETFSNNALFHMHMQVHKKRFVSHLSCKFCRKKFMHLKRLHNHEQICSKAPILESEHESSCDQVLKGSDADNISSTKDNTPPTCHEGISDSNSRSSFQMEASETLQQLHRTMKVVGGRRTYVCGVCKRSYVTLSSLRRHENVHSWQRTYPCHYCNKVFALAEYRTKHEIWHTGERRYQCIFCLETFMTYYILKNHQKSFHGIDPRLAVNKKSSNGGFKSSIYPIKLYRLLPMKFRKRQYKTYSQTFAESTESPSSGFEENILMSGTEGGCVGQPLFSMPVTFMATPKVVASVAPHITFDHTGGTQPISPEADMCPQKTVNSTSHDTQVFDGTASNNNKGSSITSYGSKVPSVIMQTRPATASAHCVGSKTETYIAKPACPGPSIDSQVPPLCQITVKIGDEAIIRRRIKGTKLFQRKRKKCKQNHLPDEDRSALTGPKEKTGKNVCLRSRTDVTPIIEPELYDDMTDRDTGDKLWRPYYSYKPKKKPKGANKPRSKHRRRGRRGRTPGRSSRSSEKTTDPAGNGKHLRKSIHKDAYSCDICKSLFSSLSTLRTHIISCRPSEPLYVCKTCGKRCPSSEVQSADSPYPHGDRDFACKNCMEDGSCFNNTFKNHNTEKRYRCSFCPQRFLYLATKKSHEKKHMEQPGKGYNCYYCPKVCKSSTTLEIHMRKHCIKTEEEEVDDKHSAKLLCSISSVREGLKTGMSENSHTDVAVAPKLEDQSEVSSNGHFQEYKRPEIKSFISPQPENTLSFPGSPTPVPLIKAWNSNPGFQEHARGQHSESDEEQRQRHGFPTGGSGSDSCLPPVGHNNLHLEPFLPSRTVMPVLLSSTRTDGRKAECKQFCKEEMSFSANY